MRWTTGVGIVLGGTGGALAALLGGPSSPPAASAPAPAPAERAAPAIEPAREPAATPTAVRDASLLPVSSVTPAPASAAPAAASAAPATASPPLVGTPLQSPTTRAALLKAELYCDQKKAFDECARAAQAYETGSAGPADPARAKRFRRIALTHLVAQCESGSPHACFELAIKYRAGTELAQNLSGAAALEVRAREICKLRPSDPYCASTD